MSETLRWWLILQLTGFFLLPLCLVLFRRLPDRGYALSKPFALLFLGYAFWLLNSLHVIPNSSGAIVFVLLALAAVAGLFAYARRDEMWEWVRAHWRYIAAVEALLLVAFLAAAWLRAQVGSIAGTEQPMDLMFVNAATRASHFPPQDPWLSGHTVAYYYFGYLIVAMTGRLAGVQPEVAYNLGLAMTAALALVGGAGVVYNLIRLHEDAAGPEPPSGDGARRTRLADVPSLLIAQRSRRMAQPPAPLPVAGTAPAPAVVAPVRPAPPAARPTVAAAPAASRPRLPDGPHGRWRAPVFALAGGLMLVVMGNLVGLLQFMSAYGIGSSGFYRWIDVQGLTAGIPKHSWYPSAYFGFFNASRIYPLDNALPDKGRVITEFPMFSFILGDLHPHVLALPFVLLAVALALTLYRSREPLDIAFWITHPVVLVASAVVLGALAFLNTWDIATLAFVVVAAASVSNFMRVRRLTLDLLVQVVSFAVPLLLLAVVFYLPFIVSISGNSQVNGLYPVISDRIVTVPGTRPVHALLYWGPLFAVVLPFVLSRLLVARDRISLRGIAIAAAAPMAIVAAWAVYFEIVLAPGFRSVPLIGTLLDKMADPRNISGAHGLATQIADRGSAWFTDIFFGAALAAALLALWLEATAKDDRDERESAVFTLGLISTALLLVLGTEFFYVGDVFNSRMNTVFKLYYDAWLLLAVAGGFSLYHLASRWRPGVPRAAAYRYAWGALAAVFLAAAALYPVGGTMDRIRPYDAAGSLMKPVDNLNGIAYYPPDELRAIDFLKQQAQGQHLVIAEAVGNDYSSASRISGATGIPTVIGWVGHEAQWRSGVCKACAGRFDDVNELYKTGDMSRVKAIVRKYGIDYIYVGPLERQTYGDAALAKFQSLPVAFQQGTVTIYRATENPLGEVQTTP